jgi:hypothetical protein
MDPKNLREEYEASSPHDEKAMFDERTPQLNGLSTPRYLDWLERRLLAAEHILVEKGVVMPEPKQKKRKAQEA